MESILELNTSLKKDSTIGKIKYRLSDSKTYTVRIVSSLKYEGPLLGITIFEQNNYKPVKLILKDVRSGKDAPDLTLYAVNISSFKDKDYRFCTSSGYVSVAKSEAANLKLRYVYITDFLKEENGDLTLFGLYI